MGLDFYGGFEGGTIEWDGWLVGAGAWQVDGPGRKDPNGDGGDYRGRPSGGVGTITHACGVASPEKRIGFAYDRGFAAAGGLSWIGTAADLGQVVINSTGGVEIRVGAAPGVLKATSLGSLPNGISYIEVHVYIHDVSGFVHVYVDGDHSTPYVTWTGDTKPGAETDIDEVWFGANNDLNTFDDYYVSSITLAYDGVAGGPFTPGDILTGATSGATAVVYSDNVAGGYLVLHTWDGTAFQDNEQIADVAGATADAHAPSAHYVSGFEPGSLLLGAVYYLEVAPTGDSAQIDFVGSDADSIDNYQLVDETPASDADYVEGLVVDEMDRYSSTGVALANIISAQVRARVQHTGATLVKGQLALKVSGVVYYSPEIATGVAFATIGHPWPVRPDTDGQWTAAFLNGVDMFGYRVKGV